MWPEVWSLKGNPNEKVKWRNDARTLHTRPIYASDFPRLLDAMAEDDLLPFITSDGLKWYLGRYEIAPIVIKRVWGLTDHQWRRVCDFVLFQDWTVEVSE